MDYSSLTMRERATIRLNELKLSQAKAARIAGLPQTTVSRFLRVGKNFTELPALAKALQTTPNWLLNGEGDKEATAKQNQQDEGEFDALCKKWLQNLQLTANITGTPLLAAAAHYAAIESKGLPLTKENYTKVLEAMKRIYGEETNDGAGNQTTN